MAYLQGKLLIASPGMMDPNFARSVVLLVQHDENGALGLVLNRPLQATVADAVGSVSDAAKSSTLPLHRGGPCGEMIMVLHRSSMASQMQVEGQLHFSSERDHIEWLLEHGCDPLKFFLGYAGWSPGQLEAEMPEGAWLVAEAEEADIFGQTPELWQQIMRRISRTMLLKYVPEKLIPEDPSVN